MFTGTVVFNVLLPSDSRTLKTKRGYVKPALAALRKLDVAVAEVGALDRYGRAELAVATVANSAHHVGQVLDECERVLIGRPELEIISARRRLHSDNDE